MGKLAAVLSLASGGLKAFGALKEGKDAKRAGREERRQYYRAAGEREAASQREAIDTRRQGKLLASRALAVAAASGGGASDVTVTDLLSDIAGQTEYEALSRMYEGSREAEDLRAQGEQSYKTGKKIKKASYMKAGGSLLSGFSGFAANWPGKK